MTNCAITTGGPRGPIDGFSVSGGSMTSKGGEGTYILRGVPPKTPLIFGARGPSRWVQHMGRGSTASNSGEGPITRRPAQVSSRDRRWSSRDPLDPRRRGSSQAAPLRVSSRDRRQLSRGYPLTRPQPLTHTCRICAWSHTSTHHIPRPHYTWERRHRGLVGL